MLFFDLKRHLNAVSSFRVSRFKSNRYVVVLFNLKF
jgi:hypothetical protein